MEQMISLYQQQMTRLALAVRSYIPLVKRTYSKHLLLLGPETKSTTACIISKGLAKQYYRDIEGNEVITGFWRMNEVMLQPENFFLEVEAPEYTELLEETELDMFSLPALLAAETSNPQLRLKETIIHISRMRQRIHHELKNRDTVTALNYLDQLYPLNRISRKDIASYLGKAPGSISRGRRRDL